MNLWGWGWCDRRAILAGCSGTAGNEVTRWSVLMMEML